MLHKLTIFKIRKITSVVLCVDPEVKMLYCPPHLCVCICISVCVCMCVCARVHASTHTHTHILIQCEQME